MATYRGKKLTPIEDAALEVLVTQLAPNPEEYRVDEAVHPMGVHVKEVPGKKVEGLPAYKVTKVGSKVKEHGGLKVGEHIHDNHIDDLADMGHKIKTEETTKTGKEETMKEQNKSKSLADLAAEEISLQKEGAFKSMVTDKMTSGKGMSFNKAVKSAQKDLDKGKNIPKTKLTPVKEDMHKKKKKHDCASKVKSEEYGIGHCMPEQHTMLEDGTVSHYDVLFDHGLVENVPVTELEILQESMHEHYDNEEKNAQLDELKPKDMGEEVQFDGEADFTFVEHNMWDIEIAEEYTYEDFVKAAMAVTNGADNAIEIAEDYFNAGDITIILEEFTRSDINDKIDTHKKAGSKVTDPKYKTKDDKLHAEFTVTDKKGMRKRHVFHGNIRRHENLGKVAVSPDKD